MPASLDDAKARGARGLTGPQTEGCVGGGSSAASEWLGPNGAAVNGCLKLQQGAL